MYDESQAYRFCYQLRGYINHRHLPLNILHSDLSTDELILNLNIKELFSSSYSWNSKVKREFKDIEEISIKHLITDLFAVYFSHHSSIMKIVKKRTGTFY